MLPETRQSEYKHVLANILRSRYVARTPPVEARSPGCCSNVENAPIDGQSPASQPRNFENAPITRQASSARRPHRAFALCRHIAGWAQACN